MIPRYQTILLIVLALASIGMGAALWHMRERAHQEMIQGHDAADSTNPPSVGAMAPPVETTTVLIAKPLPSCFAG